MTEFIINSDQLERLIEAIEHNTGREVNRMVIDGKRATEIVRCEDCRYANEDGDECVYFAAWESLPDGDEFRDVYVDVVPDGFCAWGERRQP